jgi:hypothetical protein
MGVHSRDKAQRLAWKRWQERNRDILLECGLPHDVWEEERNWQYFLGHATMSDGKQPYWFSLDQLSRSQLQRLADFLQQEFKSEQKDLLLFKVLRTELGLLQR